MRQQENLFGQKRIEIGECIDYTIESLTTYGNLHKHWAIAWSGGKDSTTLLTLVIYLLKTNQIPQPESLTVFYADTRMELPPLWIAAKEIIAKLQDLDIKVKVVMAPIDERFLVYILGRGVPPPSNTFRWCTGQIKVEPMERALQELFDQTQEKILMLTGVRQGESAIRDGRIAMSCGKDGAECGQGWYQTGLPTDICSTLAPILHWRVCMVWDWLKIFAPSPKYGGWQTEILADAYGGDEAEEINARTGCIGCPLAQQDKALAAIIKLHNWKYLTPLMDLKPIYREMRSQQHRHRQPGGQTKKDGSLEKNQQRLGPLTLIARKNFLSRILRIQKEINDTADLIVRPHIDIINEEELSRIHELIEANTFPSKWDGTEPTGDIILDKVYSDGSSMPFIFREMVGKK